MQFKSELAEVVSVLNEAGDPALAAATASYRRSALTYAGISVPERRWHGKLGFSFSWQSDRDLREIWNELWMQSTHADAMSCALDYMKERRRKYGADAEMWPMVRNWVRRVENWAHSDDLCTLYSRLLEARFEDVMPDLLRWNRTEALWPKRVSIVSLIHNTGKNAVFLPIDTVLPMIEHCLADHRDYMSKAVGWVLRELRHTYPAEVENFIEEHLRVISAQSLSRAFERASTTERTEWRLRRANACAD